MLYVQKADYEWPGEGGEPPFNPDHPVTKLDDELGDGSVMIISMPGHTPEHQSLLFKLPKTGALWCFPATPPISRTTAGIQLNKVQTLASMQRIADLLAKEQM